MSDQDPFGGPFNGQTGRVAIFEEIMRAISFNAILETGTFTGSTTEYFLNRTSIPVHSVELNLDLLQAAAERLAKYEKRRLYCGDSRGLLKGLCEKYTDFPDSRIFFYLDAHWTKDLPLREEVALIVSHWSQSVIMIDDFQVPDDDGYSFDDYGEGQTLCLDYFGWQISSLPVYFPVMRSSEETGCRRGCVVIGTDEQIRLSLDLVKSLRRCTNMYMKGG